MWKVRDESSEVSPINPAPLKLVETDVKWKVSPAGRKPNAAYRKREHLTQDELERLFAALKRNRRGHRDHMIALVTFLHGLRVSELIDLRWDDIDWRKGTIQIRRLKGSIDGVHYLEPDEARGLNNSSVSSSLRAGISSSADRAARSPASPSTR